MREIQFNELRARGLKAKLEPDNRNLRVYGNGYLPVVGKFKATIECFGQRIEKFILVTQGEGRFLLGSPAA